MANRSPRRKARIVEYQNDDLPPVYVESAQGIRTPRGSLQVTFFSDYIRHHQDTVIQLRTPADQPPGTVDVGVEDPFRLAEGDIRLVRRVEANLILTLPALKALIPWLEIKLKELEAANMQGAG